MHRAFRFLLPALLALLSAGCATWSTDERLSHLEGQTKNQHVLDLRVTHVEGRLTEVEKAIGELREGKGGARGPGKQYALSQGAGKQPATAPAAGASAPQASAASSVKPAPRTAAATPASPGGAAAAPTTPASAPSPNLTLAKARGAEPMRGPAGLGTDFFSAPAKSAAPAPAPAPAKAPVAASGPVAAPGPGTDSGPVLVPVSLSEKSGAKSAPKSAPKAPPAASGAGSATPTGKSGYDAALALYYKGDYARARDAFGSFLQASPGSSLTPNAMYWQGECLYSLGKYSDAIMVFKDVAAKYPKHDKAAASLLKAGYSYERLNDKENAKFYWQLLVDDFPGSAAAGLARKRMPS